MIIKWWWQAVIINGDWFICCSVFPAPQTSFIFISCCIDKDSFVISSSIKADHKSNPESERTHSRCVSDRETLHFRSATYKNNQQLIWGQTGEWVSPCSAQTGSANSFIYTVKKQWDSLKRWWAELLLYIRVTVEINFTVWSSSVQQSESSFQAAHDKNTTRFTNRTWLNRCKQSSESVGTVRTVLSDLSPQDHLGLIGLGCSLMVTCWFYCCLWV